AHGCPAVFDDHRPARAEAIRLRHLTLDRPTRIVQVGTQPAAAELGHDGQDARPICAVLADEEDVNVLRLGPIGADGEEQPLEPGAETDPRGWRSADLLDQAVVAAAPADRLLGPDRLVLELER